MKLLLLIMILQVSKVVPYIGTWIETMLEPTDLSAKSVVPYIGTWIETGIFVRDESKDCRTLYRYVD